MFTSSYFRRLIEDGRLVLVIDAYDELDPQSATSLTDAIAAHAASLPVAVFMRPEAANLESEMRPVVFSSMTNFIIAPLSEQAVGELLEHKVLWYHDLPRAANPDPLGRLLTNPLHLQLILKTWGTRPEATELIEASDPVRVVWERFVEMSVDRSPLVRQWPSLPRWLRSLALCADLGSTSFPLYESLYWRGARRTTLVLFAVILLPLSYRRGTPSMGVVYVIAVAYGLREYYRGLWFRAPQFVQARIPVLKPGAFYTCLMLEFAVTYQLLRLAFVQVYTVLALSVRQQSGDVLPLWRELLNPTILTIYVKEYALRAAEHSVAPGAAVAAGAAGALIAISALYSVRGDILAIYGNMLLRSDLIWPHAPLIPRIAVATVALVPALYQPPSNGAGRFLEGFAWLLGLTCLVTVLHRSVTLVALAFLARMPPLDMRRLTLDLSKTGIMHDEKGYVRSMHKRVVTVLAQDALARDLKAALRILPPSRYSDLLDGRVRAPAREWVGEVLSNASQDASLNNSLAAETALFAVYANGDLRSAERVLRGARDKFLATPKVGHLAEVVWCARREEEAAELWVSASKYLDDLYVVNKLVRWHVMSGRADEAIRSLAQLTSPKGNNSYAEVLLAEIKFRCSASDRETLAAKQTLIWLSKSADDEEARVRATLELARAAVETDGDSLEGARLLRPLLASDQEYGLVLARLAQCYLLAEDMRRAQVLASSAFDNWDWGTDPRHQLEILLTATVALKDTDAERECVRLCRYGWHLDARPQLKANLLRFLPAANGLESLFAKHDEVEQPRLLI